MKFKASILEYLGKIGDGILVLISIVYNDTYYEGTYFYTSSQLVLTVDDQLNIDIGHHILTDDDYPDLIRDIISKVALYEDIYNSLDEVDFTRWFNLDQKSSS